MEDKQTNQKVLRCKSSTDANKLAGSIYSVYQENPSSQIILRVIGAAALNQAVKAVIISNKFFSKKGILLAVRPAFCDVMGDMTAINLSVIFSSL